MKEIKSMNKLGMILGDRGDWCPEVQYETPRQMVADLEAWGLSDQVFPRHDSFLGLKHKLSESFLDTPLNKITRKKHGTFIDYVLEEANTIVPMYLADNDVQDCR